MSRVSSDNPGALGDEKESQVRTMDRLLTTTVLLMTLVITIAIELSVVPCAAESNPATTRWSVSSYIMRSIHARGSNYHHRKNSLLVGCNADPSTCSSMPGLTAVTNSSTCCNGSCKDIEFDSYNCGGCNRGCRNGFSCCYSSCVNLYAEEKNCGQCGVVCSAGPCTFGLCNYG